MSNNQKKHQKKVDRAKRVKVVLAKRREALHKERKEAEKRDRLEKQFAVKKLPIRNPKNLTDEQRKDEVVARLRDNLKALTELEQQHAANIQYAEEQRRLQMIRDKEKAEDGEPTEAQQHVIAEAEVQAENPNQPQPRISKFKGKFQEADPVNRNPPGRAYGALAGVKKKKLRFGGSADVSMSCTSTCQSQEASEKTG